MVSMDRPSRGERLSATTTRHTGSLRPPTRVSLMLTLMSAEEVSARRWLGAGVGLLPHHRAEVGHLALLQPAHELAHLAELLDQLVNLLDRGPRPVGDPRAAAALDDVRPPALVRGHRQDDRLDAVELLLVDLHLGQLVAGEPRDRPEQRRDRPHAPDLLELVEEVVEV